VDFEIRDVAIRVHDLVGEKMGIIAIEKLRIVGDDWAIEMVIALLFVEVVAFGRIENEIQLLLSRARQMAVHEFGGIADRIRGDGALALVKRSRLLLGERTTS
jgi:hypothetical protein